MSGAKASVLLSSGCHGIGCHVSRPNLACANSACPPHQGNWSKNTRLSSAVLSSRLTKTSDPTMSSQYNARIFNTPSNATRVFSANGIVSDAPNRKQRNGRLQVAFEGAGARNRTSPAKSAYRYMGTRRPKAMPWAVSQKSGPKNAMIHSKKTSASAKPQGCLTEGRVAWDTPGDTPEPPGGPLHGWAWRG